MKHLILILTLTSLCTYCAAQTKTDTTKKTVAVPVQKQQWQLNGKEKVSFTLNNIITLEALDMQAYIFVVQQGGPENITKSQKLSAYDATSILNAYNRVVATFSAVGDSINSRLVKRYNRLIDSSKAKFTQDTIKLYHH